MDRKQKIKHIQSVAFSLFLNNGYEATSIRALCKHAEIEAPSLYHFFASKKGLFLSIAHDLADQYRQESCRYFDDIPAASPSDQLFEFFRFSVWYTMHHLDETRFFLRFSLFPPIEIQQDIEDFLRIVQGHKLAQIDRLVEGCIQQGQINLPKEQAIRLVMKFVHSNTFDIVFSHWSPSQQELAELWNTFMMCQLHRNPKQSR